MAVLRRAGVVALFILGLSGPAQAQEFIGDLCRSSLTAPPARYETPEQVRWYKRFWTGECDRLRGCFPGSPNWNDLVAKILAKGGPTERTVLLPRACRLGQVIGVEWSRAKTVKRISTADLRSLYGTLNAASDPAHGLAQVETVVLTKLNRPAVNAAPPAR